MATLDSVINPDVSQEVDPLYKAARASLRPLDYTDGDGKVLGHYRAAANSPASFAPGSAAQIANFRFISPTNNAVITRVQLYVSIVTAVTAQRTDPMEVFIARNYSVDDTTNSTLANLVNQKMRTNMSTTLSTIRTSATVAGMSGGTKTVDALPIGAVGCQNLLGLGTGVATTDAYSVVTLGQHPVVLARNEGIILRWGFTALATGTVIVGWVVEWAEVGAF